MSRCSALLQNQGSFFAHLGGLPVLGLVAWLSEAPAGNSRLNYLPVLFFALDNEHPEERQFVEERRQEGGEGLPFNATRPSNKLT